MVLALIDQLFSDQYVEATYTVVELDEVGHGEDHTLIALSKCFLYPLHCKLWYLGAFDINEGSLLSDAVSGYLKV